MRYLKKLNLYRFSAGSRIIEANSSIYQAFASILSSNGAQFCDKYPCLCESPIVRIYAQLKCTRPYRLCAADMRSNLFEARVIIRRCSLVARVSPHFNQRLLSDSMEISQPNTISTTMSSTMESFPRPKRHFQQGTIFEASNRVLTTEWLIDRYFLSDAIEVLRLSRCMGILVSLLHWRIRALHFG